MNRGIQALMNGGSKFEPSIPEFVALCKPPKRTAAYHLPVNDREALADANKYPALSHSPTGEPRPSLFVEKLRKDREEKERLKHMDDDLDEKKAKFMQDLDNYINAK